jgi:hypothetical protein
MKILIQRKIITEPDIQLNQMLNDEFEKHKIKKRKKTTTNELKRLS